MHTEFFSNAGVSPWTGNTVECTLESWQRVINVNLTGTWLGMTLTSRADYEKQTPMGRIAKAKEVAATATWLCSDAASYMTGLLCRWMEE